MVLDRIRRDRFAVFAPGLAETAVIASRRRGGRKRPNAGTTLTTHPKPRTRVQSCRSSVGAWGDVRQPFASSILDHLHLTHLSAAAAALGQTLLARAHDGVKERPHQRRRPRWRVSRLDGDNRRGRSARRRRGRRITTRERTAALPRSSRRYAMRSLGSSRPSPTSRTASTRCRRS